MNDLEPLSLFIRWAHVVGMAAILGGALLVWALTARSSPVGPEARTGLLVAQHYEWIFWIAIGIQVMTGVGNLGAFGQALPSSTTAWGIRFTVKLVAVLLLALFSVPRTLAIVRTADHPSRASAALRVVPALYAATVLLVLVIVALAVWLSHG